MIIILTLTQTDRQTDKQTDLRSTVLAVLLATMGKAQARPNNQLAGAWLRVNKT